MKNRLMMMVSSDSSFQIHSWERPDLLKTLLNNVGRIWLAQCKSNSQRGIGRQMFEVSDDGKLHILTNPSSTIVMPVSLIRITSFIIFSSYLLSYGKCKESDDHFEIAREKKSGEVAKTSVNQELESPLEPSL